MSSDDHVFEGHQDVSNHCANPIYQDYFTKMADGDNN